MPRTSTYHATFLEEFWHKKRGDIITMATDTASDNGQDDEPPPSPNRSYVYPESNEQTDVKESEQYSPEQPRKSTNHISRQNSADDSDSIPIAPPTHQFVSYPSNVYDSDASDGR